MDKNTFNRIIIKVKELLNTNDKLFKECIAKEAEDGNTIDAKDVYRIIDSYTDTNQFDVEGRRIGIRYSGNYQITLVYILDSIIHSNNIWLSNSLNERFTTFIVTIINTALEEFKINSPVIKYNYTEKELCEESSLDTIIYIGVLGNFESFKLRYRGEADLKYSSFENIKLILDVSIKENKSIYTKVFAYCYYNNINVERYNNIDELLEDNLSTDYIVAYVNEDEAKLTLLKYKKIWINDFPYDGFKFEIVK